MEISETTLKGVMLIKPDVFEDHRGDFVETYNKKLLQEKGIDIEFVQDDLSMSRKDVLRGIHGDEKTWKLLSCPFGKLYFVVVNCDTESEDFGKWQHFILSDVNRLEVLVPPKHGNAYLVLSDKAVFYYKQSTYYTPGKQFSYKWNDPKFNIWWPVSNPILSRRDEAGRYVD
jgi:dTDP-4-dehydrorhamnose 3,5-epimerase